MSEKNPEPPTTSAIHTSEADVAVEGHGSAGNITDAEANSRLRSRSVYKGKFSHSCKELESAMISYDNESLVLKQLDIATKAHDRHVAANNKFLECLGSGQEHDVELNYIIPFNDDMINIRERVEGWLHECRSRKRRRSAQQSITSPNRSSKSSHYNSSRSSRSVRSVGELKLEQLKKRQEYERTVEEHRRAMENQRRAMEDQMENQRRAMENQMEDRKRMLRDLEEQRAIQDEIDHEILKETLGDVKKSVPAITSRPQPPGLQLTETEVKYNKQRQYTLGPCLTQPKYLLVSNAPSPENVCVEADLVRVDDKSTTFPPPPSHLDPNAPHFRQQNAVNPPSAPSERGSTDWAQAFANLLRLGQELPKLEVPYFNGDPLEYASFTHAFDSYIDKRVEEPSLKLNYLIQYCTGSAKGAIKHLVMAEESRGYKTARDVLQKRFGRPHVVANAQITSLTSGPQIRSNDGESLLNLATEMKRCNLVLSRLSYASELHNSSTILKVMWRLPIHLQQKWSSVANSIFECDREPNFHDLTSFIYSSASIATNYYGKNIKNTITKSNSYKPAQNKYSALTTVVENTNHSTNCPFCEDDHSLSDCNRFKHSSIKDRMGFMKRTSRCYVCLRDGHIVRGCLNRTRCTVRDCGQRHDAIFHDAFTSRYKPGETNRSNSYTGKTEQKHQAVCNIVGVQESNKVYLQIIPVRLVANGRVVFTNALLDSGSQVTLCTNSLLSELGCETTPDELHISTIQSSNKHTTVRTSFHVESMSRENSVWIDTVYGVPSLPNFDGACVDAGGLSLGSNLSNVDWPPLNTNGVGLLIGMNVPEAFVVYEQTPFHKHQPFATRTLLGWSLMGPSFKSSRSSLVNVCIHDSILQKQLERFWQTDFEPDKEDSVGMSKSDIAALNNVESSKKMIEGHYSLPLPFSVDQDSLISNKPLAEKRLWSLKKRLLRDDELKSKYVEVVEGYINAGHAEKVDTVEPDAYYLPHHAVVHPRKEKVRVVFDGAATWKGMSLNNALHSGPDINNNILDVLLKFRKHPVAIAGDITSMFHQVYVHNEHRKYLSFLWWPNGDLSLDPEVYQMCVHVFGARSSPFCASYALRQTALDFGDDFSINTSTTVLENFYVDDVLVSVENVDDAVTLRQELCYLLQRGGFNLTKWITNNKQVLETIPSNLQSSVNSVNLDKDDIPVNSALGLRWNTGCDTFEVSCDLLNKAPTRRGMLSVLSSVYDPLGIVAPFCLKAKLLIQDLCRRSYSWDQEVEEEDKVLWNRWLTDLPLLSSHSIPRCVQPKQRRKIVKQELHHFCDASLDAFSAVSYLRLIMECGKIHCSFLLGKSRLAPIKAMSIPRLELCSAVLATKLHNKVKDVFHFDSVTFWSDSTITLFSIANESKRFKIFTANRLRKICNSSNVDQWRHVPGHMNPADEGTRCASAKQFLSGRWLSGPDFLYLPESSWPEPDIKQNVSVDQLELKEDRFPKVVSCISSDLPTHCLINYFSTLGKLVRAAAWYLKFFHWLRFKTVNSKFLCGNEIKNARVKITKFVQREHFPTLFQSKPVVPKLLRKLAPYLVEDLVRVGGRLSKACTTFDVKHPVILPKSCHFTNLIVADAHQTYGHVGPHHTWSLLRQRYWIISGGNVVRSVLSSCISCKRRNVGRSTQLMGDLPECRVTPGHPAFFYTGVDLFGPFLVKRGRSQVKVYGCIFSCMTSRASHIELVDSLSTPSFINAFRRFISRRGTPSEIYCDNGTNFHGAKRVLEGSLLDWHSTEWKAFAQKSELKWNFNPPGASHMGGAWERMIRSTKQILYSMLTSQTFEFDVLHTFIVEVESILNSRPLVPVSMDVRDNTPITPNDLLRPHCNVDLPPGVFVERDLFSRNQWRKVQYLCDQFWARWSRTYLPLLLPRNKWCQPKQNVAAGDIVIVADDRYPRRCWPLGRIVQVFPDKNGFVRHVDVLFKDSVHKRPISKICVIEGTTDLTATTI